jgi:hypothetical protein
MNLGWFVHALSDFIRYFAIRKLIEPEQPHLGRWMHLALSVPRCDAFPTYLLASFVIAPARLPPFYLMQLPINFSANVIDLLL